MKTLAGLFLFSAAAISYGQSLPDCRSANLPVGSACTYVGTTLPKQTYIGDIALPSSEHVRMSEPFGSSVIAPSATGPFSGASVGGMFTAQAETLGFKSLVSSGVKVFANKQWSDLRGVDARFTAVEFSLGNVGTLAGNNHTAAFAVGPRVQHSFGPVTPYAEALVGVVHQYYWGMTESGVVGVSVRLSRHLSLIPADAEYRYASFQKSTATQNPRRGRIEFSAGMSYRFGM